MIGTPQGWIILEGVLAALVIASLVGFVLNRRGGDDASRRTIANLNARIKAWWLMVAVLAGALLAGPKPVIILFALVSFAALREFLGSGTDTKAGSRRAVTQLLCRAAFAVRTGLDEVVRRVYDSDSGLCVLVASGIYNHLQRCNKEFPGKNFSDAVGTNSLRLLHLTCPGATDAPHSGLRSCHAGSVLSVSRSGK